MRPSSIRARLGFARAIRSAPLRTAPVAGGLPCLLFLFAICPACAASGDADAAAGVDTAVAAPDVSPTVAPAVAAGEEWTDRVWVRSDETDLPGRMRIFLSDGTLVMDSCWEVYRLAAWRPEGENGIVWSEDGQEIRAEIAEASGDVLTLRLQLVDGPHEESYAPAEVPYVCPEMAR